MINSNVFRLFTFVTFALLLFTQTAAGQVNQYARDGLSFSYPADWPLSDESQAIGQKLNLDRGKDEAKILILAPRQQMDSSELAPAQARMTDSIVSVLVQAFAKAGALTEQSSISKSIGGVHAQGTRLRATLQSQLGTADIYWLVLGGRSIHLVYFGSDDARIRANDAWNMVTSTLRVSTPPADGQ